MDNVKLSFVSDRQDGGYAEPLRYSIQVPDGDGGWTSVPDTFKAPKVPAPKFNEALFETVTTDQIRVAFTNAPGHYTAISEVQVFNSGREVPEVVNDAPVVTVTIDSSRDGNLSTTLVATAVDDGLPEDGELSYGWEVVSAPEGAGVILGDDDALSTTVTGTVEGDYVLRFWAFDGELRTERAVEVTLTEVEMSAEFGASAAIRTSGTASWENHSMVNDPSTPRSSAPGTGQGWGNWGQPNNGTSPERAAWLEYSWDSPVLLASADIYWYDDNGGTRMPRPDTWVVEYTTDGEEWQPVTLTEGSSYAGALSRNAYNSLEFEPVEASSIRIRIPGVQGSGAGTGVLRWRVNGDTVDTLASPVIIRTQTGTVPELPEQLDVVFSSGARGQIPLQWQETTEAMAAATNVEPFVVSATHGACGQIPCQWQEITEEMVAETNVEPFVVYGTNGAYGLIAQAHVYVRPELSEGGISIQGAEQFAQTVQVGEQPYLPTRVEVSYNDGSRDNQAIGVEWDFDPAIVQTPGTYEIVGTLVLPWYVSSAGTTATTLTLTVEGDAPEPAFEIGRAHV